MRRGTDKDIAPSQESAAVTGGIPWLTLGAGSTGAGVGLGPLVPLEVPPHSRIYGPPPRGQRP